MPKVLLRCNNYFDVLLMLLLKCEKKITFLATQGFSAVA